MSDELKPCPFCGEAEVAMNGFLKEDFTDIDGIEPPVRTPTYWASCPTCRATGGDEIEEAAAVALWNRRA